jgi:hypothetical protein
MGTMLVFIVVGIGFCYWVAGAYEDKKFYNRVQRRQDLIRRYTSED